jgi:hypothetical protein
VTSGCRWRRFKLETAVSVCAFVQSDDTAVYRQSTFWLMLVLLINYSDVMPCPAQIACYWACSHKDLGNFRQLSFFMLGFFGFLFGSEMAGALPIVMLGRGTCLMCILSELSVSYFEHLESGLCHLHPDCVP